MSDIPSQPNLEFVRRAGKEIVCCLLPDELPFFDVIWQAIEPMLQGPVPDSANSCDFFDLFDARLGELAFATKWSKDADLLTPNVMQVLNNTLDDAINSGFCTPNQITSLVAHHSLRWRVPDRFCGMVSVFVEQFCGAVVRPDKETEELLQRGRSIIRHSRCYVVFHNGRNHFYPDVLPKKIVDLRNSVLFWIDRARNDFCSRGRTRERLRPQTERVLQFICSERNADRTVSFSELYSYVWRKDPPSDEKKMETSIEVEISALNGFADEPFERSIDPKAWIIRCDNKYKIKANMPKECCIIRQHSLPVVASI
jgi:hypothetical protein